MGPSTSARQAATVSVRADRLIVELDQDLLIDPGDPEQALLCRVDEKRLIGIERADTGWLFVNSARWIALGVTNSMLTCASR